MSELEERIKLSRAYSGLTINDLSRKIGLTNTSLKNYMNNSKNVTVEIAKKIADACNVDFVWLVTGIGEMKKINNGLTQNDISNTEQVFKLPGVVAKHMEIVKNFEDHEADLEINNDLIIIERNCRPLFEKAKTYISGMKDASIVFNDVKKTAQTTKRLG